jgi:hypothetical protein
VAPEEHIRYARFIARLAAEPQPDEAFVAAFMSDVTSDPDKMMAQAASIALIDHPGVTDSLLQTIEECVPSTWKAASARLSERRLQLKVVAAPNDAALWDEAVASGSRRVHLWLLDQPSLPRGALRMLASEGATRAVRNRASQAMQRRSGATT